MIKLICYSMVNSPPEAGVIHCMLTITYFGHSAFRIHGKKATVVTDPYDETVFGRVMVKVSADIVTVSHSHCDHSDTSRVTGDPFIVDQPGEYEIKRVFILGVPSFHDAEKGAKRGKNTIYVIEIDGVKICHLGDLGHKLTDKQQEEISGVDIIMVPVGGVYTLDVAKAVEVVNQVEPKVVMPMHYQLPDSKIKLGSLDKFLNEIGEKKARRVSVFKVEKDKFGEERKVVVLNARS